MPEIVHAMRGTGLARVSALTCECAGGSTNGCRWKSGSPSRAQICRWLSPAQPHPRAACRPSPDPYSGIAWQWSTPAAGCSASSAPCPQLRAAPSWRTPLESSLPLHTQPRHDQNMRVHHSGAARPAKILICSASPLPEVSTMWQRSTDVDAPRVTSGEAHDDHQKMGAWPSDQHDLQVCVQQPDTRLMQKPSRLVARS